LPFDDVVMFAQATSLAKIGVPSFLLGITNLSPRLRQKDDQPIAAKISISYHHITLIKVAQ